MSQLATIYQALADLTVEIQIGDVILEVPCVPLDQLPDSLDSWRGPVRMVTPAGATASGALSSVRTLGSSATAPALTVDWTIQDLFFYRGADAGIGLADLAPVLTAYAAAHMAAAARLRTARYSVTGVRYPVLGSFEWPGGSGREYDGVIAEITVREII